MCWTNTHLMILLGEFVCAENILNFLIWFVNDMSNIVCSLHLLFLMMDPMDIYFY